MWPRTVLVHGWFWLFWWVSSSSSIVILFAGWQELVIAWKCAVFCCHYVSCLVVGFHWKLFQSTMAFVESSLKALQKHEKLNFANNYCMLGGPSFQRRSRGPPTSATLFHCTSLWILMHIFWQQILWIWRLLLLHQPLQMYKIFTRRSLLPPHPSGSSSTFWWLHTKKMVK